MTDPKDFLKWIQDPHTIRNQAYRMLDLARRNQLESFYLDEAQLEPTADYVIQVIESRYPDRDIPYHSRWRHFEICPVQTVQDSLALTPQKEQGKMMFELAIISVLLDAGSGESWQFKDPVSHRTYTRSEGLALATLRLYQSGAFSNQNDPFRVDAARLLSFSEAAFKAGFQVTATNPLKGVLGRVALLNKLGETLSAQPKYFGHKGRLGDFFNTIAPSADAHQTVSAQTLFQTVLSAFQSIWPPRLIYQGLSLGDVWTHPALKTTVQGSEYIPFHKLSQWLCYSLIEPLEHMGIQVTHMDVLTALPEYRNGGLLIDMNVIQLKDKELQQQAHEPGAEVIVAWRALTIALIDLLADTIRTKLKQTTVTLPLAKILQGGTWEAGRLIALQKRPSGTPPLNIISDGTVF